MAETAGSNAPAMSPFLNNGRRGTSDERVNSENNKEGFPARDGMECGEHAFALGAMFCCRDIDID